MFEATAERIAEVVGGAVRGDGAAAVRGVSTDSRTVRAGELFVALRGEKFDGHDFVADAAEKGAAAAMVQRPVEVNIAQVIVADTLQALGELARWWRAQRDVTVVAVTGSSGKTTTKSMIAQVLALCGPTLATPGTENNEIGVPRTLLRLGGEKYCVVELAMRGEGQIAHLASIAKPDVGVITNIGQAHVGLLGGPEAIARAKAELLEALGDSGTAVLNADDRFFDWLRQAARCRVVSFGLHSGDFTAADVQTGPSGSQFMLVSPAGRVAIRLALPGRHNVVNALAAAAAAWAAGAGMDEIRAGLEAFRGEAMRSQVVRLGSGITLINDAYNANPQSMKAALEMLAEFPGRRVAVLGDMLELGDWAPEAHQQVGEQAGRAGVELLIAVGEHADEMAAAAHAAGAQAVTAPDAQAAAKIAAEAVKPGDVVLIKASRMVGLERVAEALEEVWGRE